MILISPRASPKLRGSFPDGSAAKVSAGKVGDTGDTDLVSG